MTTVMALMKTGIGTIVRTCALCCAVLSILMTPSTWQVAEAQQMELERVGPELAHPWGMEFLTSDTLLVTTRGGKLWKIKLADGAAMRITGTPDVYAHRQGGLLDVVVTDGHVYLCYSAILPGGSATAIDRAVIKGDRLTRRRTIFTGNMATKSGHHFDCHDVGAEGRRRQQVTPTVFFRLKMTPIAADMVT